MAGHFQHEGSGGNPAATTPVLTGIGDGSQATAGADWLSKSGSASIPVSRMVEMLLNPGKPFDKIARELILPRVLEPELCARLIA